MALRQVARGSRRRRWWAPLVGLALAGCSHSGGLEDTAPSAVDDEGGCMDDGDSYDPLGKADGANTSRDRPFTQLGHLRFGELVAVPTDEPRPGWSFHGAAGARLAITSHDATSLRLYGPKEPGDAWPLPPVEFASGEVTVALRATGLYALAVPTPTSETTFEVACAAGPCAPPTWTDALRDGAISLVAVGDLGLTVSDAPVDLAGGNKYAEYHYYVEMLEGFYPYLNADIRLANLETAVTVGGSRQEKTYAFRMPEPGLTAALADGFNLFGLANNHAGDFGVEGLTDTMAALNDAVARGDLLGWAGAGTGFAAAARPAVFDVRGVRVAYAACGIGYDVQAFGTGVAHVSDCYQVVDGLVATAADFRVLSVHAGVERQLTPADYVVALARHAADAGVHLIHGHHPHVVQGIERRGDGLILYSLGNFELRGARNMASLGPDSDYGMATRIQFDPARRRIVELEVVAVYDMHRAVYVLPPAAGRDRMARLNERSTSLGAGGVPLQIASTGHGHADLP